MCSQRIGLDEDLRPRSQNHCRRSTRIVSLQWLVTSIRDGAGATNIIVDCQDLCGDWDIRLGSRWSFSCRRRCHFAEVGVERRPSNERAYVHEAVPCSRRDRSVRLSVCLHGSWCGRPMTFPRVSEGICDGLSETPPKLTLFNIA